MILAKVLFQFAESFAQTAFTAGNIVVLKVGVSSGAAPAVFLTSQAYAEWVQELNPSNSNQVQQISISTKLSANSGAGCVQSGSATSEGDLVLSGDGRYITFAGYDAPVCTLS